MHAVEIGLSDPPAPQRMDHGMVLGGWKELWTQWGWVSDTVPVYKVARGRRQREC